MRVGFRDLMRWLLIVGISLLCLTFSSSKSILGFLREKVRIQPQRSGSVTFRPSSSLGGTATSGELFRMERRRKSLLTNAPPRGNTEQGAKIREWMQKRLGPGFQNCSLWGVVTTIFDPTKAVKTFLSGMNEHACLLVIGDKKSPTEYDLGKGSQSLSSAFFSVADQESLADISSFVKKLPYDHFGRKNIGYLLAIVGGAQQVFDFDDDNVIKNMTDVDLLAMQLRENSQMRVLLPSSPSETGVENPYPILGAPNTWPRGFPLEHIQKSFDDLILDEHCLDHRSIGVVQMLADGAPDVDGIYRLTGQSPDFNFSWAPRSGAHPLLAISKNSLAPWNAQATLFANSNSLWGLFLPITVHGRVSDIWRSYIVSALFKQIGLIVTFSAPAYLYQDRNYHNSLRDLNSELPLYQQAGALASFLLTQKDIFMTTSTFEDRVLELWDTLYQFGVVEGDDVELVKLWIDTIRGAGYTFPTLASSTTNNLVLHRKNAKKIHANTFVSMEQFRPVLDRDAKSDACLNLDKILFVTKTGGSFLDRARAAKKTWGMYAKHMVIFSDIEDPLIPTILPLANDPKETQFLEKQNGNMKSCLTLIHGLKLILKSPDKYDWIAIGDDDLFWQTNRLASSLSSFDANNPVLFRSPKGQNVKFKTGYSPNGDPIKQEIMSGSTAAGIVLSRGFVDLLTDTLSFDNNSIRNFCVEGNGGDDTTINYFGALLGVHPEPHIGLTYDHPKESLPSPQQISFHGRLNPRYTDPRFSISVFEEFLPVYYDETDEVCKETNPSVAGI